jgi:hypothetical protein
VGPHVGNDLLGETENLRLGGWKTVVVVFVFVVVVVVFIVFLVFLVFFVVFVVFVFVVIFCFFFPVFFAPAFFVLFPAFFFFLSSFFFVFFLAVFLSVFSSRHFGPLTFFGSHPLCTSFRAHPSTVAPNHGHGVFPVARCSPKSPRASGDSGEICHGTIW